MYIIITNKEGFFVIFQPYTELSLMQDFNR